LGVKTFWGKKKKKKKKTLASDGIGLPTLSQIYKK
jgi:hypothetical protein